ncbi:MAG TPA: hypothetical protein VEV41_10425, partial [Terriglobales bacterium]|nr:hypothetical protein [Terriglobales bacterium]
MECTRLYMCGKDCAAIRLQTLALSAVALILVSLTMLPAARAETVLTRKRVGNNSEGVTYVTSGHWKNRVVAIDGNDVLAINLGGPDDSSEDSLASDGSDNPNGALRGPGWKKIFDILALGTDVRILRGILFVPEKNEFLFSGFNTTNLFHTDEFGNPLAPIVLSGLANPTDFSQYEGLTWIPADAPKHPNTIAALMIRASDGVAHVIYIRLDGTVEAEVLPQPGTPVQAYICGIAYQPQRPGTLLLSECGAGNYAIDEDGKFLNGGPILPAPSGSGDIESIIVDRFSRVFLGAYDGHLYAYDTNYNRLPTSQDRSYVIGLGIFASSITWNSDMESFLFLNSNNNTIEAVPLSLRFKHTLFNLDPVRADNPVSISYLGAGQLAIANRTFPRGIQVANLPDGSEVERLIFLEPTYPAGRAFQPVGAGAFGPDQFIVRTIDDVSFLHIVSRTGTPDSSILPNATLPARFPDLTLTSPSVGRSVQVFDSGTGPRIFTGGTIFDISGNLLHSIDENALGVTVGLDQGTWI